MNNLAKNLTDRFGQPHVGKTISSSQFKENEQNQVNFRFENAFCFVTLIKLWLSEISENLKSNIMLYFHNNPLTLSGSKTLSDRLELLERCDLIF